VFRNGVQETVNHFLRVGLNAERKPFVVMPINVGLPEGFDCVEKIIDMLEGPMHR
jgi:hypothetical protein